MSVIRANFWQYTNGTQINPVLQMVTVGPTWTGVSSTVDASGQNWASWPVLLSTSFTPKSNNSTIYAEVATQTTAWGTAGVGIQIAICYQRTSGALDILYPSDRPSSIQSNFLQFTGSSLSNMWNSATTFGFMPNTSLTPMTITMRYASENTSTSPSIGSSTYGGTAMTIWEIAR
jgi:hypothetical protein